MIRFQPDTWRDALWRPIAMAAPDAGVYMEIMVPDLRFAALLLLSLLVIPIALRRPVLARPVVLLLCFVWLAFVPWLATSGNGRYFIAILMVAGPLCIALIHRLQITAPARLALAGLLVVVQATAVSLSDPRGAWALASWRDTYFEAELTSEDRSVPATYVLISSISYSLAAPLFPVESRWVSLASLSGELETSPDIRRAQAVLAAGKREGLPLKLMAPTQPENVLPGGQPDSHIRAEMDRLLVPHRLALAGGACHIVLSRTLASTAYRDLAQAKPGVVEKMGFWICPLQYPVEPRQKSAPAYEISRPDRVFDKLERACPRLFHPGEAKTVRMHGGFSRTYPSSDMKAYVLDNDEVHFRYWRALNSNSVGQVPQVLADGFTFDCHQVKGRSGLPWERVL